MSHQDPGLGELAREIRALHQTTREMHEENRGAMAERDRQVDIQFAHVIDNQHTMEMAIERGDGALHERIAVHEATAHHAGTFDRLNKHQERLDEHDDDLHALNQRLQFETGRIDAQREHRTASYTRFGIAGAVLVGIGAMITGLVQAAAQWFSTTGHRGP